MRRSSAPSQAERDTRALESLARKRRGFETQLREIVAGVLRFPMSQSEDFQDRSREQKWIEVGSGLGQLRSLLPADVLDQVVHTELSESLAEGFRQRHPGASVQSADVTNLPFESASLDLVLGLCAFDSFPDGAAASREIARVLKEGGRFIHFLDAATNVEPILNELVAGGRLPLPNFLADAALLEPALLDLDQMGHLCGPYHDLLSVPFAQFELVVLMLSRAGHPMVKMLERYAEPFVKRPFDALSAARAFVALTSDIKNSRPMNQALTSLVSTLRQAPYSQQIAFEMVAHSSLAHFKDRLDGHFDIKSGFSTRLSAVVYSRIYEPNQGEPLRAQLRRVGIVQNSEHWPAPVGLPVARLDPSQPDPEQTSATPQSHILREAAVYCLVAERRSQV